MAATFRHGDPLMVDYTPGTAVVAGAVIVAGDETRIAHTDIAANALGALAAGGGVYRVPKTAGSSTAIAVGKRVYWVVATGVVTETASTHKIFGVTALAATDDDTTVDVIHRPGLDAVT